MTQWTWSDLFSNDPEGTVCYCAVCGAEVIDRATHLEWHQWLEEAFLAVERGRRHA